VDKKPKLVGVIIIAWQFIDLYVDCMTFVLSPCALLLDSPARQVSWTSRARLTTVRLGSEQYFRSILRMPPNCQNEANFRRIPENHEMNYFPALENDFPVKSQDPDFTNFGCEIVTFALNPDRAEAPGCILETGK
jgi:hypothetical protein